VDVYVGVRVGWPGVVGVVPAWASDICVRVYVAVGVGQWW